MRQFFIGYVLLSVVFTSCSVTEDSVAITNNLNDSPRTTEVPTRKPTSTNVPDPSIAPTSTNVPEPNITPTSYPIATNIPVIPIKISTPTVSNAESSDSDYSNDPNNPSVVELDQDQFIIENSFGDGNKDYVTFVVPAKTEVAEIILEHYAGEDKIAFFSIQTGKQYTARDDVSKMLVYGHFGPEAGYRAVGKNLLVMPNPDVLNAVVPKTLPSGHYTMRIQQGSSSKAFYVLRGMVTKN